MVVISLCDLSGAWSQPYEDAGYGVWRVDLQKGEDVRLLEHRPMHVRGILAAPPCTMFASSGARWERTEDEMLHALSVVDACLRAVAVYKPKWWALENPIGKLRRYLGEPTLRFDPCDYGDPYTKRTCLWGSFKPPPKTNRVEPTEGSKMHLMSPGPERQNLRSVTPPGFAHAFFEANP